MKKVMVFISLLLYVLCLCLFLNACATNNGKINENAQYLEDIESETSNDKSEICSSQSGQLAATLLGGVCSIIGGVLGAITTVLISRKYDLKKLRRGYFKAYCTLLIKYQKKISDVGENNFNLVELQTFIQTFTYEFEESNDLFIYVANFYYAKQFKKFMASLNSLESRVIAEKLCARNIYHSLFDLLEKEKNAAYKKLL